MTEIEVESWIAKEKNITTTLKVLDVIRQTEKAVNLRVQAKPKKTRNCLRCGKELSHPASVHIGLGKKCAKALGISWDLPEDAGGQEIEDFKDKVRKIEKKVWIPRSAIVEGDIPDPSMPDNLGKVYLDDDMIVMDTKYYKPLVDKIKALDNRNYWEEEQIWTAPVADIEQVRDKLDKYKDKLDFSHKFKNEINRINKREELSQTVSHDLDREIVLSGGELYPFQVAGVEYIEQNDGDVLLTDQMGLGKTISAIGFLEENDAYPAIVIPPASLCINWKKELEKWTNKDVKIAEDSEVERDELAGNDVYIINYAKLRRNNNVEILGDYGYKTMIVDESHFIKNDSQRANAVLDLSDKINNRLLLTGTPVLNRPKELVNQLDALDKLDQFGGKWSFLQTYTDAHKEYGHWDFSGASNVSELQRRLRKTCMVRREKTDVLDELPDKQEFELWFDITNRSQYKQAQHDVASFLKENAKQSQKYHAILNEQDKESAERYAEEQGLNAKRAEKIVQLVTLKKLSALGKVKSVVNWTENALEQEDKIVLFAHHKEVISQLMEKLSNYNPVKLTGDMESGEREESIEKFQNDDDVRVFIGSIQASGYGITLTEARTVLFVELDWNMATHQQAMDRVHRIGQTEQVKVYWALADNTIDEYVKDMIENKGEIADVATKLKELED